MSETTDINRWVVVDTKRERKRSAMVEGAAATRTNTVVAIRTIDATIATTIGIAVQRQPATRLIPRSTIDMESRGRSSTNKAESPAATARKPRCLAVTRRAAAGATMTVPASARVHRRAATAITVVTVATVVAVIGTIVAVAVEVAATGVASAVDLLVEVATVVASVAAPSSSRTRTRSR